MNHKMTQPQSGAAYSVDFAPDGAGNFPGACFYKYVAPLALATWAGRHYAVGVFISTEITQQPNYRPGPFSNGPARSAPAASLRSFPPPRVDSLARPRVATAAVPVTRRGGKKLQSKLDGGADIF